MTRAGLNLLAFAWHCVLGILEPPWIAARASAPKRTSLFARLAALADTAVFPSWTGSIEALTLFAIPPELLEIRKIE